MRFLVLLAYDRERLKDVLGVIALDSVKMEEQGVEPRDAVAAIASFSALEAE